MLYKNKKNKKFLDFELSLVKEIIIPICFLVFTLYYAFYTYLTQVNVMWLGWFYHIPFVEKFYNHTLTLKDFFTRYEEHGLLGYNLFFLLNLIFFKLNTLFDAYLNILLVFFTALIIFFEYKSIFGKNYSFLHKVLFIPLLFVLFSVTQQSSASMETQIRLGTLFFLLTSVLISRYKIYQFKKNNLFFLLIIVLSIISINIFGTLYSLAWMTGIFLSYIIDFYKKKLISSKEMIIPIFLVFLFIFYFIEYRFVPVSQLTNSSNIFEGINFVLSHPLDYVKSLLAYLGSGILGRTLLEDKIFPWEGTFLISGFFILILYVYAIKRFFYLKLYKKSFLPLILITYTISIWVLIILGRKYSWDIGTNYWYAVHTKYGMTAILWILTIDMLKKTSKFSNIKEILLISIILMLLAFSNIADWRRVPFIRQWYLVKQAYILNPNKSMVDKDGLTPLIIPQKESLENINILKKYRLNVFNDFKK